MPVSARKSSLAGLKRGPQKYIPYRADDLRHGKRTGIAIQPVERNSDDFEPFDMVMKQADLRTPPKPRMQNKKKRGANKTPVATPPEEEYDDEYGEMSMEEDSAFDQIQLQDMLLIQLHHIVSVATFGLYAYMRVRYTPGFRNTPTQYYSQTNGRPSGAHRVGSSSRTIPCSM